MGRLLQPFQQQLHIRREVQRVRNNDHVELLVEFGQFPGLYEEFALRHANPGRIDLGRGQIDAGFPGDIQAGEQFAGTAADLEHRGIGRDQEIVIMRQQAAVAAGKAVGFRRRGIVKRAKFLEPEPGDVGGGGHVRSSTRRPIPTWSGSP